MKILRRKTKTIRIGGVYIGGAHPVAIQSMSKGKTADVQATVRQIKELEHAGCDIVRVAVRNSLDAQAIKRIKEQVKLPIVADIHFHWRLALEAIDHGADKIRLNPGNINDKAQIKEIVRAAKGAGVPIRVGLNSGSVGGAKDMPDALVKSALDYIKTLEGCKFYDIVISLKASNILDTVEAYRRISKICAYPLHLGVTATGAPYKGAIKSSIALGALLLEGIGDTIRVSLTDKPQKEVAVAKIILQSLGLRRAGIEVISCPTCGRCEVNLVKLVKELEDKLATSHRPLAAKPLKVAVMGCVVNGPGEAKEADLGIAFGKKEGLFFKQGRPLKKVSSFGCVGSILKEIKKING